MELLQEQINHLRREVEARGTKEELANVVETKFVQKMGEVISSLADRFISKDGFKTKVIGLEKNVKNIYELITMINEREKIETTDVMMTKKPLGPGQCASCEKDIVNLAGVQADYYSWQKFPFKPAESRIAAVSIIFSVVWLYLVRTRILEDVEEHGLAKQRRQWTQAVRRSGQQVGKTGHQSDNYRCVHADPTARWVLKDPAKVQKRLPGQGQELTPESRL